MNPPAPDLEYQIRSQEPVERPEDRAVEHIEPAAGVERVRQIGLLYQEFIGNGRIVERHGAGKVAVPGDTV